MEGEKGLVWHLDFVGGPGVTTRVLGCVSGVHNIHNCVAQFPCFQIVKSKRSYSEKGFEKLMILFRNWEIKPAIMKEGGTFKSLLFCGSNKLLLIKAHQSGTPWAISLVRRDVRVTEG